MLNCKQTSELVSQAIDRRLTLHERLGVRLHLLFCRMCARFERQIQFLHRAAREYGQRGILATGQWRLSVDARERIRGALSREP